MPSPPDDEHNQESKRRTGSGFTKRLALARQERLEQRGQQPWLVKKLAVFIAIALIAYSTYVYVRLCEPMINHRPMALGTKAEGSK
jgi:palmitoyltransferase